MARRPIVTLPRPAGGCVDFVSFITLVWTRGGGRERGGPFATLGHRPRRTAKVELTFGSYALLSFGDAWITFQLPAMPSCKRMERGMSKFLKLIHNENGATAIEYALIAALIAIAAIGAMTNIGTKLSSTYQNVASSLK
jgi:pilus assembly protein Flp/PilA